MHKGGIWNVYLLHVVISYTYNFYQRRGRGTRLKRQAFVPQYGCNSHPIPPFDDVLGSGSATDTPFADAKPVTLIIWTTSHCTQHYSVRASSRMSTVDDAGMSDHFDGRQVKEGVVIFPLKRYVYSTLASRTIAPLIPSLSAYLHPRQNQCKQTTKFHSNKQCMAPQSVTVSSEFCGFT